MRAEVGNSAKAALLRRPRDLMPGDLVEVDGALCEVVSEPFLGMSGGSVFDVPQLFWRARVQAADDGPQRFHATWDVDQDVVVRDRRDR